MEWRWVGTTSYPMRYSSKKPGNSARKNHDHPQRNESWEERLNELIVE
jgi:hypothetical protein